MVIEDAALLNRRVTLMTPAALFSRRLQFCQCLAEPDGENEVLKCHGVISGAGSQMAKVLMETSLFQSGHFASQ